MGWFQHICAYALLFAVSALAAAEAPFYRAESDSSMLAEVVPCEIRSIRKPIVAKSVSIESDAIAEVVDLRAMTIAAGKPNVATGVNASYASPLLAEIIEDHIFPATLSRAVSADNITEYKLAENAPKEHLFTYPPDSGTILELDECIEIAIQNNLGLKLSRINDRQSDYSVRIASAQFFPTFTQSILHTNSQDIGPRGAHADGTVSVQSGITQTSPWGTRLDFIVDESRRNPDQASHTATARLAQPLWKGAGPDVNLAQIRTARINRLINRANLDLDTQVLIFNIRKAYAELIRLLQVRDSDRDARRSARFFLDYIVANEKAGRVTRLELSQANLQLKSRELSLVADERQLGTAYDALKQLMDIDLEENIRVVAPPVEVGDATLDDIEENDFEDVLETVESEGLVYIIRRNTQTGAAAGERRALFQASHFNEAQVLEEALGNRIDLLNSRRALALQHLQTMVAKKGLGYQVDLVGSFGHSSIEGGPRSPDAVTGSNNWSVGINAVVPWGKISDRATYETALLDLQKTEIALKRARTTVHQEVRDNLRRLDEAQKTILILALRVEQAKLNVRATFALFRRGFKDSFQLVAVKDDLLVAKNNFISNKLGYMVVLAQLEVTVGKPTGRVDLEGETSGGQVEAKLPESVLRKILPRQAPDADLTEADDPLNKSRVYRHDPKPEPDCRSRFTPQH